MCIRDSAKAMRIDILTVVPELLRSPLNESILKRAQEKGLVEIVVHNLHDYAHDKRKTTDDYPFGGEAGMVMKPEPVFELVEKLQTERRYDEIVARPRLDPIFTLILVGLANASFCRLFGGEWCAVGIVFTATLLGFYLKQRMQAKGFNHYVIFIASAFAASMYASVAMIFDTTSEIAIATSVLYLIPGVPLINGVIDIVEGHILIGCSRLINALLLIICIAIGLSATLLMVKDGLL